MDPFDLWSKWTPYQIRPEDLEKVALMQLDLAIHQSLLQKIQLLLVQSEQKSAADNTKITREKDLRVKESVTEEQWNMYVNF